MVKRASFRDQRGGILTIVVLVAGLVMVIIAMCFSFNGFLTRCTDGQSKIDALALDMARSINVGDRVGQINELSEGARELVYVSDQAASGCADETGLSEFAGLYEELAREAHEGQQLVESERQNQIRLISSEIFAKAHAHNSSVSAAAPFQMFWLQAREPRIDRIDIGTIKNMETNIEALRGVDELVEQDDKQGFVDRRSELYLGRSRLKLAALPASVDGICAPMRNTNPQTFVSFNTLLKDGHPVTTYMDNLPCAVQIWCSLEASLGRNGEHKGNIAQVATAVTNGSVCGH